MRIFIQLTGEKLDIQDIQSGLNTSNWKVTQELDGFYLSSSDLDKLTDHSDILSKARQFLDAANGAANIVHSNHKPVGLGALKERNENGGFNIYISLSDTIQARSRLTATMTTNQDPDPKTIKTTIERWIEIADREENVRDVLHFFNETTWWNLYKIYEIIKDDVGGQNRLYQLIPKTEIKQFTQAAQSRDLLGDHARHASKTYVPPTTPLTLSQAQTTLKKLFANWIQLKT
jgi:hypothetical protein